VRTRLPIKAKVAIVTAALTFVILSLFATVIGALAEQRITDGFEDELRATAADLQDQIELERTGGGYTLSDQDRDLLRAAAAGGAVVRVVDVNGQVAYATSTRDLGPPIDGVTDAGDFRVVSEQLVVPDVQTDGTFDPLPLPVAREIGWVQYAETEASVQTTINRVRLFLAFGVLGGTALAFLGGLLVARRAMRPISGLTKAAREVARTRDPDVRLPKPLAQDEVSELAFTLEDMLRELGAARGETEATLDRQRAFVADASHELRTPLTSILANLELLESDLDGEQREMAASALRSSRRMRRLVADLLLLARADAGRQAPHQPVDLSEVVTDAAAELEPVAGDHEISVSAPGGMHVAGARDELHRLVLNLMENALRHTDPGTAVEATVERRNGAVVLSVEDDGPGIPHELREKVFERFYRGSGDRSGSSGLGLSIVRAVAESHRGSVQLEEPLDGRGARFVVRIPTA
jgi:two-component system, OmpR family, sensor kinase